MSLMPKSCGKLSLGAEIVDGIRVHQKGRQMPNLPAGPFARLKSGAILSVAGNPVQALVSDDEGVTWRVLPAFAGEGRPASAHTGALLVSRTGAAVVGFPNLSEKHWTWSNELRDAPGARLPTCVTRSTDGGETWDEPRTLHQDWTGATRDAIQTQDGRIVFTSMKMRSNPGRHTVMCYASDDDGATWQASNVTDLGGNGHHGGVTEGTIVQLTDGRLLQYARTPWGQLWRIESVDDGRAWHAYGPSGIEASSTPAMLKRVASGRIALLWNRRRPEGADDWPLQGGDGVWSATPASNFRAELSLSFSEDECETWSPPIVIARSDLAVQGRRPEVSYPYAFEPEAGTLWITAHRWDLRMSLREADFAA